MHSAMVEPHYFILLYFIHNCFHFFCPALGMEPLASLYSIHDSHRAIRLFGRLSTQRKEHTATLLYYLLDAILVIHLVILLLYLLSAHRKNDRSNLYGP